MFGHYRGAVLRNLGSIALLLAFAVSLSAVERMKVDRYRVDDLNLSQVWLLSQPVAPATELLVFRNGVLMCETDDYDVAGKTITFTRQQIAAGDMIVFVYFTPVT